VSIAENVDAAHDMILAGRRIGLKHIAKTLKISYECVHHIVRVDCDMKKKIGKMDSQVPECRLKASTSESVALNLYPF
jgi:hypothetical protein